MAGIGSHQAVDACWTRCSQSSRCTRAHHYRIHLWDGEKAARAEVGGAAAAKIGPRHRPHCGTCRATPTPSCKRYADAAWQQEGSARVDHAYMIRDRVMPDQIHNYAHNNEWLIRNLSHIGRSQDAIALAKNMVELPRHPKYNGAGKTGNSASYGRARLFEVLDRYEQWDELLALADTMYLEPTDAPPSKSSGSCAIGRAYGSKGDAGQTSRNDPRPGQREKTDRAVRSAERDGLAGTARLRSA